MTEDFPKTDNFEHHRRRVSDTRIDARLPVEFTALDGEPVRATLTSIVVRPLGDSAYCEIALETDASTAQTIMERGWFHLFLSPEGRPDFDPDTPVELRAALRPNLADALSAAEGDAETVLKALTPTKKNDLGQLFQWRHTECWMALELVQAVRLPDELSDEGTLKEGVQTEWRAYFRSRAASPAQDGGGPADLAAFVETCLQRNELKYEVLDERLIRLRFSSDAGNWTSLLRLEPEDGLCLLYSVFPEAVPESMRSYVAVRLMSENYDLIYGSFEMDETDGELRLRTTLVHGNPPDADAFHTHFAEHIAMMEHYLPIVRELTHPNH
jgi:hypothetical protein